MVLFEMIELCLNLFKMSSGYNLPHFYTVDRRNSAYVSDEESHVQVVCFHTSVQYSGCLDSLVIFVIENFLMHFWEFKVLWHENAGRYSKSDLHGSHFSFPLMHQSCEKLCRLY